MQQHPQSSKKRAAPSSSPLRQYNVPYHGHPQLDSVWRRQAHRQGRASMPGPGSARKPAAARMVVSNRGIPTKTERRAYDEDESASSGPNNRGRAQTKQIPLSRTYRATPQRSSITDKKYGFVNEDVRQQPRRMAARKTELELDSDEEDEEDEEEEEDESELSDDAAHASGTEEPQSSDDEDEDEQPEDIPQPVLPQVIEIRETPPPSPIPALNILDAVAPEVEPLIVTEYAGRIPFLLRNLRRGFKIYCRKRGLPIKTKPLSQPRLDLTFRVADSNEQPFIKTASAYQCPFCVLHSPFPTREMLQVHLEEGHTDIGAAWEHVEDEHWKISLLLSNDEPETAILLTPVPASMPLLPSIPDDPLGPMARYPYFPAKSEWGGDDVTFSTRPGGAKPYDLLRLLPMKPFGVLAWTVVEREEEIFENDEIPDEQKVMHALWGRWIFHHRLKFIANYCKGTEMFIEEYWRMIQLAAGWAALRMFLLMLLANRFLSGRDVAYLLRFYETKTASTRL